MARVARTSGPSMGPLHVQLYTERLPALLRCSGHQETSGSNALSLVTEERLGYSTDCFMSPSRLRDIAAAPAQWALRPRGSPAPYVSRRIDALLIDNTAKPSAS